MSLSRLTRKLHLSDEKRRDEPLGSASQKPLQHPQGLVVLAEGTDPAVE